MQLNDCPIKYLKTKKVIQSRLKPVVTKNMHKTIYIKWYCLQLVYGAIFPFPQNLPTCVQFYFHCQGDYDMLCARQIIKR